MSRELLVYVGTYTLRGSVGIYIYRLDLITGALEFVSKASGVDNPSFLAFDSQHRHLYAVNELKMFRGKPTGTVSAFTVNPRNGELTYLNKKISHGTDPCHLIVDKTSKYVLVANYTSGSLCVLPILRDGRLGNATDFVQHQGSSVNPIRQEGPHAHSIILNESNQYAYAPDLGIDKIMIYRFDAVKSKLVPHKQPWLEVKDGAGPRHFTFSPNGQYAYLINELDSTIVALKYDREDGTLSVLQTVPALPEGFAGTSTCADIHVASSGKFLYGSNRGHDSIVIYRIDSSSGMLEYVGHETTLGKTPRNFAIDPTNQFLLAANQDTDNIVTFRIDQETGKLKPTGFVAEVSMPVCIQMMFLDR